LTTTELGRSDEKVIEEGWGSPFDWTGEEMQNENKDSVKILG